MKSSFQNATIAAVALALLFQLGCSKSSPTEPETYWFRIGTYSSSSVMLQNSFGNATIVRIRTYLDGELLSDSGETFPKAAVDLNANRRRNVSLGPHTLRIEITKQTSSPNNYFLLDFPVCIYTNDSSYWISERIVAATTLPGRTQLLATGEFFEYQIAFK